MFQSPLMSFSTVTSEYMFTQISINTDYFSKQTSPHVMALNCPQAQHQADCTFPFGRAVGPGCGGSHKPVATGQRPRSVQTPQVGKRK